MEKNAPGSEHFQRPAILGATHVGAQIAAQFANVGIHVGLYDKSHAGDPNYIAKKAVAALFHTRPSPFVGPEAATWIEARNFQDHWPLLCGHDLVIECLPEDTLKKQGLWSRIAPGLARDCVVLSHSAGLPMAEISHALPATLRARFMGIHFFRPLRHQRIVELIPTQYSDDALVQKIAAYFSDHLNCAVVTAPDTENYISTRLINSLINIAFYHAYDCDISLAAFETLTQMIMDRAAGGLCHLLDLIGINRQWECRVIAEDHDYFGKMLEPPQLLEILLTEGRTGSELLRGFYNYQYKPHVLENIIGEACAPFAVNAALRLAFEQRDWAALRAFGSPYAGFVCAVLRDWWQYANYLIRTTGCSAKEIDTLLMHAFAWKSGLYGLLQQFSQSAINKSLQLDDQAGLLTYKPVVFWPQKRQKVLLQQQASNPFASVSRLLFHYDASSAWVYNDGLLIWQPHQENVGFADDLMGELLEACQYARQADQYLLIYHHGSQFGYRDDLKLKRAENKQRIAVYEQLKQVLLALRTHPRAVIISLSGFLGDFGTAVLMQADQLLLNVDVNWKLYAPLNSLPPLGGVWFEWLRRLPYLSRVHYLEQVHAVLSEHVSLQAAGDVHSSRAAGLLRMHDRVLNSKKMLAQTTFDLADAWLRIGQPRITRYAQYRLRAPDIALLQQRSIESAQPELYCALLKLLTGQTRNNTVSLHMLLEQESELFEKMVRQYQQNAAV